MGKPCTTNGGHWPRNNQHKQQSQERVNFVSEDGLVEIITTAGKKFPAHDYQVVVLRLRPQPGTRILQLNDGSGGIEILLKHVEVANHLQALNLADPKAKYTWRDVPEKPKSRTELWRRINDRRHGNSQSLPQIRPSGAQSSAG